MSDHTPSQAEGDRDDEQDTTPRPTPSQAEGDRDDTSPRDEGDGDRTETTGTEEAT
ncbi:hypothetical protein [Streptomyces cahuitamycinicus]|uniref:hypothetical protein n=1 Tax=Streptomyces cahuitamycinicus TaxID=2070367 RepID=UPI0015E0CC1E|nr:hypothetical protein [Streptomyces cahuitamycinicus]